MNSTINAFNELATTYSTLEKEEILSENETDSKFKTLLNLNLNPYKNFYINKLPKYDLSDKDNPNSYEEFVVLTDKLCSRQITGNEAKVEVQKFFSTLAEEQASLYKKILLKEALGVGIKTVNKVYGKSFIPSFEVMLAPNELADITKIKYPTYIQPKLDGFRCVFVPSQTEEDFVFISRQGKAFGNENLKKYFSCLNKISAYVLDGELYHHGTKFNKLASILSSEDARVPQGLKFVIYDCVPYDDWINQSCKIPYSERLKNLRVLINGSINQYDKIIDITNDAAETSAEVKSIYRNYLKDGYEGAMIKNPESLYQWKRVTVKNGAMLKLKPFKTIDVKIKAIYDGEGNFTGKAGGVVFDNGSCSVRCGSGFDLALREKMAKSPQDYIGKTIEIKYFEETEDGSLRFPTFIRFRPDKD